MITLPRLLRLAGASCAFALLALLLVGVPWGLCHYIGWPLPDHVPTLDELKAALLNPLSVTLLLDVLACFAWLLWLVFTVDTLRCLLDAVRGVHPVAAGPLHALAAVLVATVVAGLLSRSSPPSTVAINEMSFSTPALARMEESPRQPAEVVVRLPEHGVHDSLWRIARRELGDGARWPEIFEANRGKPQPDGRALRDPELIQPGWVLRLPSTPPVAPAEPITPPSAPPASVPPAPAAPSEGQPVTRCCGS